MALVSPKRKSSPPIAEEPAHATVMESYSGIDARKGARFRFRRKPLTPETRSSLHRNLRAGPEAPSNVPSTCSPGMVPLVRSEGHPSLPLRLRQLPLLLRQAHLSKISTRRSISRPPKSWLDWVETGQIRISAFSSHWRNLRRYLRPDSARPERTDTARQKRSQKAPFRFNDLPRPIPESTAKPHFSPIR
jgi:hypothetical protein